MERELLISEAAAKRIAVLKTEQGNEDLMLRITVSGGGCSGFQNSFEFSDEVHDDDHVFERDGIKVVTDDASLDLLDKSEIDFVDELMGAYFQVNNPNATSQCGCGTSFSIEIK